MVVTCTSRLAFSIEANLSPCTKPLVIEVRSHRKTVGLYYSEKWDFNSTGRFSITLPILSCFCFADNTFCSEPTTLNTPTATPRTNRTSTVFTENNKNQNINMLTLSGSLCIFVIILLTVVVIVICKRRSGKMKRRGEVMKTEENTDYGIYDDGPMYNVVTDENEYYSS